MKVSWDGVEKIFSREQLDPSTPDYTGRNFWDVLYLVDDQGFVAYQSDVSNSNDIGQLYQRKVRDLVINLKSFWKSSREIGSQCIFNSRQDPYTRDAYATSKWNCDCPGGILDH